MRLVDDLQRGVENLYLLVATGAEMIPNLLHSFSTSAGSSVSPSPDLTQDMGLDLN